MLTPAPDRPPDWSRILSLAVASLFLFVKALGGGPEALLKALPIAVFLLACIWCPDELGSLTTSLPSPVSIRPVTQQSPGCMVKAVAWVALLVIALAPFVAVLLYELNWL